MAYPGISANPSRRPTLPNRAATRPETPLQPPCPFSPSVSLRAVKTSEGDGAEAFRGPKEKQSFFS